MRHDRTFEEIALSIAELGKDEIKARLLNFEGTFCLDFTEEYLDALPLDRLRHILLAAVTTKIKHKNVK